MRQFLIYDGEDSRDFGVYISGSGVFNAPAKAYEMISVQGRSGDLIGNEKRLKNIEVTYPAFIYTDFKNSLAAWRNFLLSRNGYCKLIDSYHPNEFRKAAYIGGLDVEPTAKNDAGSFDILFNCKPQRYLLSGEQKHTFTASGTIINPSAFPSQPFIRIYGTGTVGIGNNAITVTYAVGGYTDVDCEMMDAYYGSINCNRYVQIQNNDFPVLHEGSNGITLTGVTKVEIVPRWYIA